MQPPTLLNPHARKFFQQLSALADVASAAWQRYLRRRRLRSTIRQLEGLSDVTLKDIGLHRCEIAAAVMRTGPGSIQQRLANTCAAHEADDAEHSTRARSGDRPSRCFVHRI